MQEPAMERAFLVKLGLKRLKEQAAHVRKEIEWETEFIEETTALLPKLTSTRQDKEQQIAERQARVEQLRISLQMIEVGMEWFQAEHKRLSAPKRE